MSETVWQSSLSQTLFGIRLCIFLIFLFCIFETLNCLKLSGNPLSLTLFGIHLFILHFLFCILYSVFCILYSVFYILHFGNTKLSGYPLSLTLFGIHLLAETDQGAKGLALKIN